MKIRTKKSNFLYYGSLILITNNVLYDLMIFKYIRALLLGAVCLFYGWKKRKKIFKNLGKGNYWIYLFLIWEFISTRMHKLDVLSFIGSSLTIILIMFLTLSQTSETFENYIRCVYLFSVSFLGINAFIMLVVPNGLDSFSNGWGWSSYKYLSGQTLNMFLLLIIPYLLGNIMNNIENMKNTSKYAAINNIIYLTYVFLYLFWIPKTETTAGFVCLLLLIANIVFNNKRFDFKLPLYLVAVFMVVSTAGIVFSDFLLSNQFVQFFVEKILHKTITFTGRTEIWAKAIIAFRKSPIVGYGVGAQVVTYINGINVNEHNQILHILIEGGVVALILFILSVIIFIKNIRLIQNISIENAFIVSFLCVYLIFFTTALGLAATWEFYLMLMLTMLITDRKIGIRL